jgi:hypothetical protein
MPQRLMLAAVLPDAAFGAPAGASQRMLRMTGRCGVSSIR